MSSECDNEPQILVVDDEERICRLIQTFLEKAGYDVVTCTGGEEGIQAFQQHQDSVACCIVDLNMPGIDGAETMRRIRAIQPATHAVVCSGYGDERMGGVRNAAAKTVFVEKPIDMRELVAYVKEMLAD